MSRWDLELVRMVLTAGGMRILKPEEEKTLLGAADPHLRPIITVALYTGMRRGELLSPDWEQVDLRRGFITVSKSKSGKVRHIQINAIVREALVMADGMVGEDQSTQPVENMV